MKGLAPPPASPSRGPSEEKQCQAQAPWQIGWSDWKQILKRVWSEVETDHLSLVAGGVAYYAFLSIFPALAAFTALFGVLADPIDVETQVSRFTAILPPSAGGLVQEQMMRLAGIADDTLGWGVTLGFFVAIWSANRGMKGVILAIGLAYDELEQRGFLRLNLLSFGMTVAALALSALVLTLVAVVPVVLRLMGLDPFTTSIIDMVRWPILAALLLFAFAVLYYRAPNRHPPRWQWLTPGSLLATVLLLAASGLLSLYVSNFGSYNEIYGSLAGVAILMLWLYIGAFVVLLGAELNAESERQTVCDTTVGPPRPRGQRQAAVADDVAVSR